MKKLLALLLALVMVFSLAACAKDSGDDDKDEKEATEESAAPEKEDKEDKAETDEDKDSKPASKGDYNELVDVMNDFAKSPSLKAIAKISGGTLVGEELYDFMATYFGLVGLSDDDLVEMLSADMPDLSDQQVTGAAAEALTADEIADAQAQLEDYCDSLEEMIAEIEAEMDGNSDADWQDAADQLGKTVDEVKAFYNDVLDALQGMFDKLDGAEITEGYRVAAEGRDDSEPICMYFVGSEWFTEGLFESSF